MLEGCVGSSRGSEIEFDEDLALTRRVCLTGGKRYGSILENGSTDRAKVCAIIDAGVGPADLHAVKDIEIFHSQFEIEALREIEAFGKSNILVALEGVAEVTQLARLVARSESGIGEGSRVKDRQSLVIVVVVNA